MFDAESNLGTFEGGSVLSVGDFLYSIALFFWFNVSLLLASCVVVGGHILKKDSLVKNNHHFRLLNNYEKRLDF